MKSTLRTLGVLLISGLAAHQVALAGVVFTIESRDKNTGEALDSTEVLVEGELLKMTFLEQGRQGAGIESSTSGVVTAGESAGAAAGAMVGGSMAGGRAAHGSGGGSNAEMVFRAGPREMVVIEHGNREYYVFDEAALASLREQRENVIPQMQQFDALREQAFNDALARLNEQAMSPQERAAAEQMLRSTMGMPAAPASESSDAAIVRGESDTVNGYPVVWYERPGRGRVAVADWDDLGPLAEARETLESFFRFMADMQRGGFEADSSFLDAMREVDGFPVAGESFGGGLEDDEWTLESIRERDLDPDAFEPPKGYRLRTMGGFFQ